MSEISTPPPQEDVSSAVYKAIRDAYYPELIKAASAARSRAQASYTIAAAIATALVTAGILTDFEKRPDNVKALGLLAVGGWILAGLIFMRAVSADLATTPPGQTPHSGDTFVQSVIEGVRAEVAEVNSWLSGALVFTVGAAAATVATLVLATTTKEEKKADVAAVVAVSDRGGVALGRLCDKLKGRRQVSGELDVGSLTKSLVELKLPASTCAQAASGAKQLLLRLSPKDVFAVRTNVAPAKTKLKPSQR